MPTTNYQYSGSFAPGTYIPVFDPTGNKAENKVTNELHTLTAETDRNFHVIVPLFAPFFYEGFKLYLKEAGASTTYNELEEGTDYIFAYSFLGATRGTAKPVYGAISLINNQLSGIFKLEYQALGGNWSLNQNTLNTILSNQIQNPRSTSWEQIVQLPTVFPVIDHEWNLKDLIGASDLVEAIEKVSTSLTTTGGGGGNSNEALLLINTHIEETNNPHSTTKAQVGLDKVNNFPTATDIQAVETTNDTTYVTPRSANLAANKVVTDHETKQDPHPQYMTQTEVESIVSNLSTPSFKGSYLGVATLNVSNYVIGLSSGVSLTNGLFSIKFDSENPSSATLTIGTDTAKTLVNEEGNPIEAKEILANQTRTLVYNGTNFIVLGTMKYISLPFSSSSLSSLTQNDAVRFNNGGLAKAIANNTPPNNNVIGFVDKDSNRVVYGGVLGGFTGLETDSVYYLSPTTAGAITKTKPYVDAIKVGIAKSSTELYVAITAAAPNDNVPTGSNGNKIFYMNDKIITASHVIAANINAMSIGPITIADGVEVTFEDPDTGVWTII